MTETAGATITLALNNVMERIIAAARRAGRDPAEITLVAVSKSVDASKALMAIEAGATDLGESRVQEAREKKAVIGARARLHMIGPLQTNKAKYLPGLFDLVHSIDRLDLLQEIDRRARLAGVVIEGLIQVNVGREPQKSGVAPEEAGGLIEAAAQLAGVTIRGLMTIPPHHPDPEKGRPYYRELFTLFSNLKEKTPAAASFDILSAGMSDDFEVAIEEGSTLVRVGSAIFGARN